jgi:dihydropteroate synthase
MIAASQFFRTSMFDISAKLRLGPYELSLARPLVMGVLNVTPDSFSDRQSLPSTADAVAEGLRLIDAGADILDIGGESTRPGASPLPAEDELARVIPVVQQLAALQRVPISIDTRKAVVMQAAVNAGAVAINDVAALREPASLETAAALNASVILMHMQGDPATMQQAPHYDDVVESVARFLTERIFACQMAGIDRKKIIIDPGFGFGKTLAHNIALLQRLERLKELDCPVLIGLSRKRMIGELTGREAPQERLAGSLAAAVLAAERGASIIRTHDVAATLDAMKVFAGIGKLANKPNPKAAPVLF